MKLSVIIVNYNVRYFLEQCLLSVRKAIAELDAEVFVVDNNSVDSSAQMVREKFPGVILIENNENIGFARANNQAIIRSQGEYVLLLNPDTVVEHDTFSKIVTFMDSHLDAGGLGVKMVDGNGKFLPESKRGLPTPAVAFYKIFGLSKLFPRSKRFGKYHLGYLDKDEIHPVDILSGACMLIRKTVLDRIGLLDETFFMYGEDIDLSYRITQAGYRNYYFPKARIIHYKGESTKKSSVNYVRVFYQAMAIFARKHFSRQHASLFSLLINLAVYFRAFIALLARFLKSIFLPLLDAGLIYLGIYVIKTYWEENIIYLDGGHYPIELVAVAIPVYVLIWLIAVFLSGGYDRPIRPNRIYRGIFFGTITILVIYSLLPETYRYSRALILLGALWAIIIMTLIRYMLHLSGARNFRIKQYTGRRYVIIGEKEEANRVLDLLRRATPDPGFIGLVNVRKEINSGQGFIGNIEQINDIISIYRIEEVIFCAKDISAQEIIDQMTGLHNTQVEYKIAPPESLAIIGSHSISTSGDPYIIDINSVDKPGNRRTKRVFDLLTSPLLLASLPVSIFIVRKPLLFIRNCFLVFFGRYTWIGYSTENHAATTHLPKLRKGVLNPTDIFKNPSFDTQTIYRLNLLYARNFSLANEFTILYRGFRRLGGP
ncbi:MAG: glycosyltransferase [Lentimicrobiaceae bacterium]|nr:glycosyltransferase [Lentimicrobiaceae bacterium]